MHRPNESGRPSASALREILARVAPDAHARALVHAVPPGRLRMGRRISGGKTGDVAGEAELTEAVRIHGVKTPLLARIGPEGEYELLADFEIAAAAQRVGLPTIPVLVVKLDDATANTITMVAALEREGVSPWEEAQGLAEVSERLREQGQPAGAAALSRMLGHDARWVAERLRIAESIGPQVVAQSGVAIHDLNVLSLASLLRATEGATVAERAVRLRAAANAEEA